MVGGREGRVVSVGGGGEGWRDGGREGNRGRREGGELNKL